MSEEKKRSFIGAILHELLEAFKANWEKFANRTWGKVPEDIREKVSIAVHIVNNIKKFVDSPVADFITSIIPGEIDDKIKVYLRTVLPIILEKYKVVSGDDLTAEDSHLIATNITKELTDLSFGQSALTTEVGYQNLKDSL